MKTVITIDGPAGSGKSTLSRMLAEWLGCSFLDTGAMYRAVAFEARRRGLDFSKEQEVGALCRSLDLRLRMENGCQRVWLGDEDVSDRIRSPQMDELSSRISTIQSVRVAMTDLQRALARTGPVVAEGRDMGTVVFPDARIKFFLTASPVARASRRYKEFKEKGRNASLEQVEKEMFERDRQDSQRKVAPLQPASDALLIDSTDLTTEDVLEVMIAVVKKAEPSMPSRSEGL